MINDFMADDAPKMLKSKLPDGADLVLSDMAPALTGHSTTDHFENRDCGRGGLSFRLRGTDPGWLLRRKGISRRDEQHLATR